MLRIHNLFRHRPGFDSCQLKYTGRGNQITLNSQATSRWRRGVQATGPSLCVSLTPHLHRRPYHLDRWIVAELYMPLLFMRDCDSGDGFGVGQIPNSCYGVVYFSDSLSSGQLAGLNSENGGVSDAKILV
ncbi:hypothetical protein CMV_009181 [Castanea mollissima]|uniref:Uncharacterized protein n=1 Tax=Castanea mollissima TaxID=60419 RepID=A0A8J4W1L4_9ROSI|nr:hypothetical protein CMV_009181 [Castanea mollissima]